MYNSNSHRCTTFSRTSVATVGRNVIHRNMDFLNKPMSEIWKSTKETLAEIMDMNDSVIGSGKQQQQRPGAAGSVEGSGHGANTDENGSRDRPSLQTRTAGDLGSANQETVKHRREKPTVYQKHSVSKTKRPVSEDFHGKHDSPSTSETVHSTHHAHSQQKEQSTRHSLNASLGKLWKELKTFNMNSASTKSETTTKKSHHHGKGKPGLQGKERKTLDSSRENENEVLRSHRAHSHSRSRQGSLSDSQHFRSNSTDRASIKKYKEAADKSRPFLRSASDDAMMSAEQVVQREGEEDSEDVSAEKMKTKILSMWNNVRYGWTVKTRTAFSLASPIWILGKCFQHKTEDVDEQLPGLEAVKSPAMELFKREFSSRIWLTYRREFPQLAGSSYTTDCGWGCMLRSGQMMLAQALVQHFLGRDWNYYNVQGVEEQRYHHEIVRWFGDQPDDMSPFSLHRLVEIGKASGKKAGDWYGPASVAHIFKEAMDQAMDLNPLLEQVCVYVAQDCTIYTGDVMNLCKGRRTSSLKPVYSDQSSSVAPPATVSHPHRSSHVLPAVPSSDGVDTPFTSAVTASAGLDSEVVNRTDEKGLKSLQQSRVQQSSQADFPSSSELNGSSSHPAHPPSVLPTNSDQDDVAQPSLARPKKSPPSVSTKPKTGHRPHWNGSSHKAEELSPNPQGEDASRQAELSTAAHQSDREPVTASSATQTEQARTEGEGSSTWCAVVILVPVRLGGDEVNPIYISSVQALFTLDCCIGIIGGKPKHSLYYVGFQDEKLIHLDPHYCQPVVDMKSREFSLTSFHCMSPRKMAINKMDPSCTIGFYLRTEEDFNQFCAAVPSIVQGPTTGSNSRDYPMFILRDGSCHDWNGQHSANEDKPERYLRVRLVNQNGQLIAPMRETDDFVFLDS